MRRKPGSQFSILNSQFIRLAFLRLLAALASPLARPRPAEVASVLYVKPDHLGDLLLATPVLTALRQGFPTARITALVGPWSAVALRRNPDIDALLTCPFPAFERRPAGDGQGARGDGQKRSIVHRLSSIVHRLSSIVGRLSSLAQPYLTLLRYAALLRAGRYDLAIIGRDDHWWGAALALLAGVPLRVGFAVPECRPFLTNALPWNPRDHVTAQGLALVAVSISTQNGGVGQGKTVQAWKSTQNNELSQFSILNSQFPELSQFSILNSQFLPAQDDITWAHEWRAAHGIADERLVVIHPGTGGPAKLWPSARWARVADALQEAGARVALTGGPGEEQLVADVAAQMRSRALTLAGQTSVGQLAALMRRAALVLGVDSGPLHLAAAQGVPTVHLYGPGDAARFGPWGDQARHVVVREELWCSPCGVFSACPRGLAQPECMQLISVARVVEVALDQLRVQSSEFKVKSCS